MALHALHGYIYLKRPSGPDTGTVSTAVEPSATVQPLPQREDIGRLLIVWMETIDGRRPPKALKNGRFHPDILAQLSGHQRSIQAKGGARSGVVASKIKTLHIQPTATQTVRFCASAVIGGRVRAIAGTTTLARIVTPPSQSSSVGGVGTKARTTKGPPRPTRKEWRVETLQII